MKHTESTLEGLVNLLPQLSRQQGWEEKIDMHTVFTRWHDLLDEETAAHCQPLKIVKNVLWIEVENSAWLQQLQFQTVQLLDVFNQSLRKSHLQGLRFCVAGQERKCAREQEIVLRYVPPPDEDLARFEQQIESIPDADAREALLRFWYLSHACRKE